MCESVIAPMIAVGWSLLLAYAILHFTSYRRVWGGAAAIRDFLRPAAILRVRSRLATCNPPPAPFDTVMLHAERLVYGLLRVVFAAVAVGVVAPRFGGNHGREFRADEWAVAVEIRADGRPVGATEEQLLTCVEMLPFDALEPQVGRLLGPNGATADLPAIAWRISRNVRLTSKGEFGVFYFQPIERSSLMELETVRSVVSNTVDAHSHGSYYTVTDERHGTSVRCVISAHDEAPR